MTRAVDARDAQQVLRLLSRHVPALTHEALANMCDVAQSTITRAIGGHGLTHPRTVHNVLNNLGAPERQPAALRAPSAAEPALPMDTGFDRMLAQDARHTLRQARTVLAKAVHEPALDLLEAEVEHLARCYVSHPLTDLHTHIRELRGDTFALLAATSHPAQTRRLHIAAAQLAGLQAHICLDLGRYAHAETNTDAAWALATSTGDPGLCGWVRALQSLIAYWDGRYRDAQQAAEDGLTQRVTDSNLARLHALRARAYAAQGERSSALSAIRAAHEQSHHPVLPGVLGFPPAKAHAYASSSLLMLATPQDRRRSVDHAQQAIRLYSAAEAPDQSFGDLLAARLDLATAHVHARDLDAALEEVRTVTSAPPEQRTASITQRSQRLDRLVQENADSKATSARQIHSRINAFCHQAAPLAAGGPATAR
ncbi:XRE family transcriptional regulator [Nocardiopsis sp. NRRL B-16309]|uniref:XRE family transcriptional regulator n=1 Tax=Nocardiopsis sp. NRRL B-16309 TaxID=1519494 RepID=UPI000AE8FC26|nr:XRE family transcriptional regulator [Nocardiopsis sp. NRRL B-16309]